MTDADSQEAIYTRLQYTYTLFQDIQQRFNGAAIERGGYERTDVTSNKSFRIAIAAQKLVHEHGVCFAPSTREEFQIFPHEISVYMKQLLQDIVSPVLQRYGIV